MYGNRSRKSDRHDFVGFAKSFWHREPYNFKAKKLKSLGLNISALNWFTSYLLDRKQLANISGVTSGFENIECGVPQGSIIGPLLFLIDTNDMEM